MKTKTEKQLEKEIEDRYKEVRKTYEDYGRANNWTEKNIDRETKQEIDENDYETTILKAKLEGYRKAKEEFNNCVKKLKEEGNKLVNHHQKYIREQGKDNPESDFDKGAFCGVAQMLSEIDKIMGKLN